MKRLVLLFALVGCGSTVAEPVEIEQGILVAIEPTRLTVSCSLGEDKNACHCEMSECGPAALAEVARQCNHLRAVAKIVIE
jgi:hypothetical protein